MGEGTIDGLKCPLLEQYDVGDIKQMNLEVTKLMEKQLSEDFLSSLPDYAMVFK